MLNNFRGEGQKCIVYKKRGVHHYKFCMTDVNYNLLMEKVISFSSFNNFTAISYLSHVNWWNFFINRLEAFSFRSQYGISNSRNGFFTVNILVEQQTINKRWKNKRCSNISNDTFYKSLRISSFAVFCFDCSDFDVEIWCYFSRSMQIPWNGVLLISFQNFEHPRYSFLIFF